MARLIDADALHRKVKMETNPYGKPTIDYDSGVKVLEWIDKAPTVDAVEAVRCRSCKDYNWIPNCSRPMCTNPHGLTIAKPDDFCSYGQRKDGDRNG